MTERVSHPEMSPLNLVASLNMACSNTWGMSAGARADWACEHARGSLLAGETSAPACFPWRYMRTQNAEGIKYVGDTRCAPGDTYDGKCDGTYGHISDGARVPSGDVATERGRTFEHALQQHTVHERRRTVGVGVRVCPWLPPHLSNPSPFPPGKWWYVHGIQGSIHPTWERCPLLYITPRLARPGPAPQPDGDARA